MRSRCAGTAGAVRGSDHGARAPRVQSGVVNMAALASAGAGRVCDHGALDLAVLLLASLLFSDTVSGKRKNDKH